MTAAAVGKALWAFASASSVADVVEPLILDGAVAVSAVILLEMLRFTRSPADHQRLATNLAGLPRVNTTEDVCQRALDVQRELAARDEHRGVKVPDLLIAAAAEAASLTVLQLRRRLRPDRGSHQPGRRMGSRARFGRLIRRTLSRERSTVKGSSMLICMRTTINLPDGLAEAAKRRAAEDGRTFTSLVEEGLRRVLADDGAAHAVRLPSYGDPAGRLLVDVTDREALWAALDADAAR
ncbi:MAG: PIN domain-containing protein [Pseudonocardiaceae bacterium]